MNVPHWTSLSLANVRSPGQLSIRRHADRRHGDQHSLSDFLLGRLAATNALIQAAPNTLDMKQTYLGVYAQDTWRVGSKLTLNYGLRWEPFFPQQLRNGAVYQFDMTRFTQNIHSTVFPNGPAGLYFPGDPGFPTKAGMEKQWEQFRPARRRRLGSDRQRQDLDPGLVTASRIEFVNGQFHLNTSVAPPWGSEVRLNAPGAASTIRSSAVRAGRPTSSRSPSIRTRRFRSTGRSSA